MDMETIQQTPGSSREIHHLEQVVLRVGDQQDAAYGTTGSGFGAIQDAARMLIS